MMHGTRLSWHAEFFFFFFFVISRRGVNKTGRRKQRETRIDCDTLLFLYKGRLWRAPAGYWFSELLASHCYPRALSALHWTHAAPQAVKPGSRNRPHNTQPRAASIQQLPLRRRKWSTFGEMKATRLLLAYKKSFFLQIAEVNLAHPSWKTPIWSFFFFFLAIWLPMAGKAGNNGSLKYTEGNQEGEEITISL